MTLSLLGLDGTQTLLVGLIFLWTGFVRSGLGFGGAALGLPLMLFLIDRPLVWLPIIGAHLLFFSALTLRTRLRHVDWAYLRASAGWILPAALVGVLGLLSLPTRWLLLFIYGVTLFYACLWVLGWNIHSRGGWADRLLLVLGGYIAGTSLTGAPLMVAVYMRHVDRARLRNTLFVLWFILVTIKMSTFAAVGVDLRLGTALTLLPVAGVGHLLGLRVHEFVLRNDAAFRRWIGAGLVVVCGLALARL